MVKAALCILGEGGEAQETAILTRVLSHKHLDITPSFCTLTASRSNWRLLHSLRVEGSCYILKCCEASHCASDVCFPLSCFYRLSSFGWSWLGECWLFLLHSSSKRFCGCNCQQTGCEGLCEWVLHAGTLQHKHECAQGEMLLSWNTDRRHDEAAWGNSSQRYCGCISSAHYEILGDAELCRVYALCAISIFTWFYLYILFHGGCHIIKV